MGGFPACDSLVLAVTLVLETPNSDIHQCPACGAQCAVDKSAMTTAARNTQPVRIACHKCDMVFMPVKNDAVPDLAPSSAASARSIHTAGQQPADNDQAHQDRKESTPADNSLRYGKCPKCTGTFLMPTTPLGDDDLIAENILIECPHCSRKMPPLAVMRIDARADITMSTNPQARAKSARRHDDLIKYVAALMVGGGIIAAVPAMVILGLTPGASIFESAVPATPHFAVSNSSFRPFSDADGSGVIVTVNLANLGTAEGTPQIVNVTLLDTEGQEITRRQIARFATPMAAGETQALVARFTSPAAPVADIEVSLPSR
jgi:hypothetical protein